PLCITSLTPRRGVTTLLFTTASLSLLPLFLYNPPPTPQTYTLSLHDALPISSNIPASRKGARNIHRNRRTSLRTFSGDCGGCCRSEEHTSELQSLRHLVCRLLLEKKKTQASLHPYN